MNTSLFSDVSPGSLVPIQTVWGRDHAFVPAPLPPDWHFRTEFWELLMEATNRLSLLEGFGRKLVDPMILLRPMRDREAIRSSEIEGTYANPRELLLFELAERDQRGRSEANDDAREVLNYRQAMQHAESTDLPICLRLLRELHQILMRGVRGADKTPGEFRRVQVAIGDGGRFIPAPPGELMNLLGPLESYLHVEKPKYHPLVDCFLAHYQFEAIHPFSDGNGRVGRLLLSLMIQRSCDLTQPWLYLSEYFERTRQQYYEGLFGISTNGAWADWVAYCLRGVCEQAEVTIQRFERLLDTRQAFVERVHQIGGSNRLVGIVEGVFESPFIRTTAVRDRFGVSYNSAKADIEKLVAAGVLAELPDQYPKTYYAPEVFEIAYEGLG